jgi:hypothetical protein
MAGISKQQAKKNIGRLTGLKGAALDRAAAKFVRKQRGRKRK